MSIYAVIHTGGKQYRVSPGDVVRVEKLTAQPGETIEFGRVYLLAHDGRITAGNPVLKNARVMAHVLDHDRGEKIIIFKHRRRKGYRKTIGHRQSFTELKIIELVYEGASYREQPEKPKHSQKPAAAAAAPSVDKAGISKQQTKAKKKPEKQAERETKPEKQTSETAPLPLQPEKPQPAEQHVAQESNPVSAAASLERTPKDGPAIPAAPSREPEKLLPVARPAAEAQPLHMGPQERPASDRRGHWWILAAVIAALALGLVLFFWNNRPSPLPETGQGTVSNPAREKQHKAPPPVRDVKVKKTAPIDKPSTPAQPPD